VLPSCAVPVQKAFPCGYAKSFHSKKRSNGKLWLHIPKQNLLLLSVLISIWIKDIQFTIYVKMCHSYRITFVKLLSKDTCIRMRIVICLQTPTIFWIFGGSISLSYSMYVGLKLLGRQNYLYIISRPVTIVKVNYTSI
jgi:hypothetical protein